METIEGYVDRFKFKNIENGYAVMVLIYEEQELNCVGELANIAEGENLELTGEYTKHPTHGMQFSVKSYTVKEPTDELSMERYLGSGAIKGIGAAMAARIVRRFKQDTFRIIDEEPERLAEVKGISQRKAMEIADQVREKRDLRQAMIYLQKYGISLKLAVKIYERYGQELYGVIQQNPYRMAEDISGVGFRIADEIANKVGIRTDSDFRIRSGLLYVLQQASIDGNTYLPKEVLSERTAVLLGVDGELIERHFMELSIERKITMKEQNGITAVYATNFYLAEMNVAARLARLDENYDVPDIELETELRKICREQDIELDEKQADAVREAVRNGVMILTGGPGTGKTTTINSIIQYFEHAGLDMMLAAPTGRAAKRMSEMTGYEARTIHRMLELNGEYEEQAGFGRNEDNPLETDVVIVDEVSMVDLPLMQSLLRAIAPGTRFILVGDVNQLPSVGPGSVLKDIIDAKRFHVVQLTKIFRQASQSDIIVNAHKINAGEPVVLDNKSRDFFFLKRNDADIIINVVLQLVRDKMPKYVNATVNDIQVLTPMRKGNLGVERLNSIMQQYLNPPKPGKKEKPVGERVFREGDKVMQTKNNYQLEWEIRSGYGFAIDHGTGVFNGDMGIIKEINFFTEKVIIEYEEGKIVEHPFANLDELEHAYAITIHKSQGSEYPAVVIPLLGGPRMLMNRNLLYTAVTRAKSCVTIVGSDGCFMDMIQNVSEQKRYSGLRNRIEELP